MPNIYSMTLRCTNGHYHQQRGRRAIYDQITRQMKGLILRGGAGGGGEALPSMRLLAKELHFRHHHQARIRGWNERGFITTVPGKGLFVAPQNPSWRGRRRSTGVEEHLSRAVDIAKVGGVSLAG